MASAMLPVSTRSQLLKHLNQNLKNLSKLNKSLEEIGIEYSNVEEQIRGSLEWFSKQSLEGLQTFQFFVQLVGIRKQGQRLNNEKSLSTISLATSVLGFESFNIILTDSERPPESYQTDASQLAKQMHADFLVLSKELKELLKEEKVIMETVLQHKEAINTTKSTQKAYQTQQQGIRSEIQEISSQLESMKTHVFPIFKTYLQEDGLLTDLTTVTQYAKGVEQQAIGTEINSLLQTVIKITENWDSVAGIHHLAKKLQKNQASFSRELDSFISQTKLVVGVATSSVAAGVKSVEEPQSSQSSQQSRGKSRKSHLTSRPEKEITNATLLKRETKTSPVQQQQKVGFGDVARLPFNYFKSTIGKLLGIQRKVIKQLLKLPTYNLYEKEEDENSSSGEEAGRGGDGGGGAGGGSSGSGGGSQEDVTAPIDENEKGNEQSNNPFLKPKRKPALTHIAHNAMALNVINRVREKLEGIDSADRALSVSEQVDWVIKEATSVNNLSKMYEGWAPWI